MGGGGGDGGGSNLVDSRTKSVKNWKKKVFQNNSKNFFIYKQNSSLSDMHCKKSQRKAFKKK